MQKMIEAKVIFDESEIQFNGFQVCEHVDGKYWFIIGDNGEYLHECKDLEQAIQYCMENKP